MKKILIWAIIIASFSSVKAQTAYSIIGNTNWSAISPAPTTSDVIIIENGAILTLNVSNAVCSSIQIAGGGTNKGNGTLLFNLGSQLTVSGSVTLGTKNGPSYTGTLDMTNGGTLICGSILLGDGTNNKVFTPGTGTIQLTTTNTLPTSIFTSFNNLTISGGTTTLGTSIAVTGTLMQTGGNIAVGANTLTVSGSHNVGTNTVTGAGTYTFSGSTFTTANLLGISTSGATGSIQTNTRNFNNGNYVFNGTAAQVTGNALPSTINSLTVQNTGGVFSLSNSYTSMSTMNVNAGGKLTINSGQSVVGTTLNILSDATNGTGTIVNNGTLTFTQAVVNQYLRADRRTWYMTSPVGSATPAPAPASIYTYNETAGDPAGWTTTSTTTKGIGYSITPDLTSYTSISFTGSLNDGSIPLSLTRTTGKNKEGFNLIGNPYASYFNLFKIFDTDNDNDIDINDTDQNILPTYWVRTKSLTTWGWDTYNMAAGLGTANVSGLSLTNLIPPMQAFWVKVNTNAGASITFNNALRAHKDVSNNKFRVPGVITSSNKILRLVVSNEINTDETILYFNANASNDYDMYDSQKMLNGTTSTVPDIYTAVGANQLVINGMNSIDYDAEIPLYFNANASTSSTHTITNSELSNFEQGTQIWLKNNLTGISQLISDGTPYTFDIAETGVNPKFSIYFKAPGISTKFANLNKNNIFVFANQDGQIAVKCNDEIANDATVTIYNNIGQLLIKRALTGNLTLIDKKMTSGVYIAKVSNAGNKTIERIIIK